VSYLLQAEVSDEEEKDIDDVVLVPDDKYSAQSLDKMITLVAVLVEKSRIDRQLHLPLRDMQALTGGKVRSTAPPVMFFVPESHSLP